MVTALNGWPLWTSGGAPDASTTPPPCGRTPRSCPVHCVDRRASADAGRSGLRGEQDTITVACKKPKGGGLPSTHRTVNKIHNGKRAAGKRGNSLPKMTFTALRNVSLCCPWTIGRIAAAAVVVLHADRGRTT